MSQPIALSSEVPATCRACNVRHAGMCAVLTAAELATMARSARRTQHAPGEPLVVEDSKLTSYANVTDGVVKLSRVLRNGRQQVVGLQFAPDLLGRLFGRENLVNVEAASEVDLCRIPKDVLEQLVATNPVLKQRLLDQSLQDLDEARDWMVTLGRKDARQRVASLLLLVARRCGAPGIDDPDRVVFDLPLTRSDMADFLGLTIETVSRQISRLRHEGVVQVANHRHVVIPSLPRLETLAG
ncbi:MAG: Crp/Fnr family transcriptional regulator [Devosia sp.]|jgi:CRP/FNR family transcriptional regulator|uniref:Crp/Fnr family transcriptional regulator n=1 Tax=Devosia sp. 66-22 TaxID=1895753 RepID=UPI000925CF8E|nr:Crp/Fnr family transcriptional regulator [Devosia sp. 66-22]MBN9348611.1 Crp/Fnr family transcriptional regulator [Devosia sp.]OJX48576.1 MAG: transcriptional regulator [Devosia sp. 66-22]